MSSPHGCNLLGFITCKYIQNHKLIWCTIHRLYVRCTQLGVPFIGCMHAVHNIWCTVHRLYVRCTQHLVYRSWAVCTLYTTFGVPVHWLYVRCTHIFGVPFIGCMYAVHNLCTVHRLYVRCIQLALPSSRVCTLNCSFQVY